MKKNLIWLTAIISGISIFANKFGVTMNNPFVFTFMKNAMVAVFLFSIIMIVKDFKQFKNLNFKDWRTLIVIGIIGGGIPFLLFFKGLSLTTSAKAGFIHKTMFVYVGILAYTFLKERFDSKTIIATLLLLVGNFLFLKLTWQPFNIGDLLIFVATLLWAAENTLSKYVIKNISSNIVAFSRMFFGSIFILGFLIATGNIADMFVLTSAQVVWSMVTAVLLMGYVFTWYTGLKTISVTKASVILLLGSPITTFLNIISTGNMIALQQVVGVVLLVLGVYTFYYSVKEVKLPEPSKFII